MTATVLVLGGTGQVGRAAAQSALDRGAQVTTLNRGISGSSVTGARTLIADRTNPAEVETALSGHSWDAVIDTWAGAPSAVQHTANLLARRAGHYSYVSSRAVYAPPIGWPSTRRHPSSRQIRLLATPPSIPQRNAAASSPSSAHSASAP